MTDFTNLISKAVTAKMTPAFIEKEVDSRVEKLIIESVDRALRAYSDTGQLLQKAVEDALRVDRLDLPSYGEIVTKMLKAQIEARVSELVAGRLAEDMEEILKLAPKEIRLSQIADIMRDGHDEGYGPVITVLVDQNEYGSTWLYLDESDVYKLSDKYKCRHRLLVSKDGKIASARTDGKERADTKQIGRAFGFDQMIRAWVACGTVITIDEDEVVTSVGDY